MTNNKTHYLSIVRDLYNGEIIDYQLSPTLSYEFVYKNIISAWYKTNKPRGVILHSDHGGHYTNLEYQYLCKQIGIIISMSRKGNSVDNGACETWFSSFKQESIYCLPRKLLNKENIYKIINNYVEFYKFVRPMKKFKNESNRISTDSLLGSFNCQLFLTIGRVAQMVRFYKKHKMFL